MPLLNIAVVSASRGHIPWTVVQIEPGLTFVQLFEKIVAGVHPMLSLDAVLTGVTEYRNIGICGAGNLLNIS